MCPRSRDAPATVIHGALTGSDHYLFFIILTTLLTLATVLMFHNKWRMPIYNLTNGDQPGGGGWKGVARVVTH